MESTRATRRAGIQLASSAATSRSAPAPPTATGSVSGGQGRAGALERGRQSGKHSRDERHRQGEQHDTPVHSWFNGDLERES